MNRVFSLTMISLGFSLSSLDGAERLSSKPFVYVIDFLDRNKTPEVLRHFTVKRLDALTRLSDAEAISCLGKDVKDIGVRGVAIVA